MERARRDEQDVVGLDHPVLGVDRGAFDQRQQRFGQRIGRKPSGGLELTPGASAVAETAPKNGNAS